MTDNEITIFTSEAVAALAALAPAAKSSAEITSLVDDAARSPRNTIRAHLALVGSAPPDLAQMQEDGVPQGEIARALHVWLGPLTPVAGSDHRLWSYLSTVTFRDYMELRWPMKDPPSIRFLERWVVGKPTRSTLARNGISRLWWGAHLTHDPRLERPRSRGSADPYAYTSELFRKEDRFVGIVEREVGSVPNVVFPLLDHLPADATEGYVRSLLKEITLVGGYADLASFTAQESQNRITEIVTFKD